MLIDESASNALNSVRIASKVNGIVCGFHSSYFSASERPYVCTLEIAQFTEDALEHFHM